MNDIFSDVPEALSNTLEILDKVEVYSLDHDPIMPFFPIPESFGTEEEWRQKFTEQQLYDEFTSDENGENQCHLRKVRRKSRNWVATTRSIASSSRPTIWQNSAYEGARRIYGDPTTRGGERACEV